MNDMQPRRAPEATGAGMNIREPMPVPEKRGPGRPKGYSPSRKKADAILPANAALAVAAKTARSLKALTPAERRQVMDILGALL